MEEFCYSYIIGWYNWGWNSRTNYDSNILWGVSKDILVKIENLYYGIHLIGWKRWGDDSQGEIYSIGQDLCRIKYCDGYLENKIPEYFIC